MQFTLPIGVMHEGQLLRDFTLSRARGSLRAEFRDAPRAQIDLVALRHVVKSLGPLVAINDQVLRRLTIVDRDYIHAAMTATRYEGKLPVEHQCDCGHKIEDSVLVDDVAVLPGQGDPEFRDGRACYRLEVKQPSTGNTVVAVIAVPCVSDDIRTLEVQSQIMEQERNPEKAGKKITRGDAALMQICSTMLEWAGGPALRIGQLRDMDLDDFDALNDALSKMDPPRLDNEAIVNCPECGAEHTVPIEFDRWLLPLAPRAGQQS